MQSENRREADWEQGMKRSGEGSCLLEAGKPCSELPRWSISISEWSCSCAATTTLQGGTSENGALWMCLQAGGNSYFQTRLKIQTSDVWEANKNNNNNKKKQRQTKKFQIFEEDWVLQVFWSRILNNSVDSTGSSEAVWKHAHAWQQFSMVCLIKESVAQPLVFSV